MRVMAIRQACLEPLALCVSGRERMFNGWAAASGQKRMIFPPSFPPVSATMRCRQSRPEQGTAVRPRGPGPWRGSRNGDAARIKN